jgi:hypothetical protein
MKDDCVAGDAVFAAQTPLFVRPILTRTKLLHTCVLVFLSIVADRLLREREREILFPIVGFEISVVVLRKLHTLVGGTQGRQESNSHEASEL